jgi:hypothetical protein
MVAPLGAYVHSEIREGTFHLFDDPIAMQALGHFVLSLTGYHARAAPHAKFHIDYHAVPFVFLHGRLAIP